jgi:hypothetical protein
LDLEDKGIRNELQELASSGATIGTLDASLRKHELSGDDYEELWLYAWTLERQVAMAPSRARSQNGFEYGDLEAS